MNHTVLIILVLCCTSIHLACSPQPDMKAIQHVTALTEVFGDGQKLTAAIVEYETAIDNKSIAIADFSIPNRTITNVYSNHSPGKSSTGVNGKYVILELSPTDAGAATFIPKGKESEIIDPSVAVSQVGQLETTDGNRIEPANKAVLTDKTINLIVDEFTQHAFKDARTGITVHYNLFTPKNYDKRKSYPLVMFIHDAGVVSTNVKATLMQGLGAVVWASPSEQAKHECFVLAPQYAVVTTNDQSEFTADLDATVHLLDALTTQYSIDKNRLYTTGQSMGCMSSIALNIKYPDLFATSYLVAGQWDAAKVSPMATDNLWIVVSQGDEKAYPGMNAITTALEEAGSAVARAVWNGRATPEEFTQRVKEVLTQGRKIQYTPLQKGTVVPPDMQGQGGSDHRATWRIAYTIEGIRDWLFRQKKG